MSSLNAIVVTTSEEIETIRRNRRKSKLSVPHISWEWMSVEDLKHYYETTTQEYIQIEKDVIITLVRGVGKGKLRAFKKPNGEIVYQNNPLYNMDGR